MLMELTIRNFAIIDELNVAFANGLNIMTGETGAGKSIIIGAVNLLLGDRASADMIRTSEDTALVEAFFHVGGKASVTAMLTEWGLRDGDDLVIRRIISRTGKNRVYINGHGATLTMLSALGEALMNICGQHEHQELLKEENHVEILDEFGRLFPLRQAYGETYQNVQSLKERVRTLENINRQKAEREDFLRFQLGEIEELRPHPGEDSTLTEEKNILINVRKLSDWAVSAHDALYSGEGAVLEKLRFAMNAIHDIRQIDPRLAISEDEFAAHFYQMEEAAFTLRDYAKGLSFDPGRLEAIDDRLASLSRLKRKHGGTLEEVLSKMALMEDELTRIRSADEELAALSETLKMSFEQLDIKAKALSNARKGAALKLQKAIEGEIHTLRMAGARFEVVFRERAEAEERYTSTGTDDIVFYLSANTGEALKPLYSVASGGELSRVVLAMKKVLAGVGFAGTIVFDEVDSGIGGATAQIVGEKIREVASRHQVLCITHLPQIACFADRHYRVAKHLKGDKTITCVDLLSDDDRQEELARMLGGVDVTETTRRHAREMLSGASGRAQIHHKISNKTRGE